MRRAKLWAASAVTSVAALVLFQTLWAMYGPDAAGGKVLDLHDTLLVAVPVVVFVLAMGMGKGHPSIRRD